MAPRNGFRLNLAGFRELRRNPEVVADLARRAGQVAAAAGPGFEARQAPGVNRARFVVVPTTPEAYKANTTSYAVLRALPAGRD